GEVAADLRRRLPVVGRLPDGLRGREQDVRIDWREDDGEGPLPALDDRRGVLAREESRIRIDLAQVAGPAIEAGDEAAVVRSGEEDVDVLRIRRDVAVLVAADRIERLLVAPAPPPPTPRQAACAPPPPPPTVPLPPPPPAP